ncbi:MAG TPA: RidA family protein [Bacteroidia bacterium]|nr:RidA family protein [Bacteroidia bacterium]HNT80743.1 RidA family protein [Bacteroidia bacterium]
MKRTNIYSNTIWEQQFSYARAVKVGQIIEVSGTTAVEGDQVLFAGDLYQQTMFVFEKIEKALTQLGASRKDVLRTRMYVTRIALAEEAGRAHGEFFKNIDPVATMVEVSALMHPDMLIEIEVSAVLSSSENR